VRDQPGRGGWWPNERDVETLIVHRADVLATRPFHQSERDVGRCRPPRRHDPRQNGQRRRTEESDAQHSAQPCGGGAGGGPGKVGLRQRLAGMPEHRVTSLGQLHLAPVPLEQHRADLPLESLNLLAQRRLGNVQPLRRAPKVKFLGHGDE
jgi:hypothetical protein